MVDRLLLQAQFLPHAHPDFVCEVFMVASEQKLTLLSVRGEPVQHDDMRKRSRSEKKCGLPIWRLQDGS